MAKNGIQLVREDGIVWRDEDHLHPFDDNELSAFDKMIMVLGSPLDDVIVESVPRETEEEQCVIEVQGELVGCGAKPSI